MQSKGPARQHGAFEITAYCLNFIILKCHSEADHIEDWRFNPLFHQ
jgi:hypothetical protein